MSAAEKAIENVGFASPPSPADQVVLDQANAKVEWLEGPGACVPESRHRLIESGAGLATLGSYVAMFLVVRRGVPVLAELPRPSLRGADLFTTIVAPFFAMRCSSCMSDSGSRRCSST